MIKFQIDLSAKALDFHLYSSKVVVFCFFLLAEVTTVAYFTHSACVNYIVKEKVLCLSTHKITSEKVP